MSQLKVLEFKNKAQAEIVTRMPDGTIISVRRKIDGKMLYVGINGITATKNEARTYYIDYFCEDLIHVSFRTEIDNSSSFKSALIENLEINHILRDNIL